MQVYAKCLIGKKEFSEAKTILNKLLLKDSNNAEDYYLLGECNLGSGDYEIGKGRFRKAESLDPNNYCVLRGLGECMLRENNL